MVREHLCNSGRCTSNCGVGMACGRKQRIEFTLRLCRCSLLAGRLMQPTLAHKSHDVTTACLELISLDLWALWKAASFASLADLAGQGNPCSWSLETCHTFDCKTVSAKTETSRTSRSRVVSDGEGESERERRRECQARQSLVWSLVTCFADWFLHQVVCCPALSRRSRQVLWDWKGGYRKAPNVLWDIFRLISCKNLKRTLNYKRQEIMTFQVISKLRT